MEPLKILLFGSTGLIGNTVLRQALDRGHKVTAIVRSKQRLGDFQHENLEVKEGNSMDVKTFDEAMEGKDAVISCISARNRMYINVNLYSVSINEIHQSMVKHGVKRCVFMSGWGVGSTRGAPWWAKIVLLFAKNHLNDMARMETFLAAHSEEMNYTVVRPGQVTQDPMMEGELLTCDNDSWVANTSFKISKHNVAKFLLDSLDSTTYERKMVSIGLKA